jgi:predicted Zn finger-like uncharacterized protein
MLISCTSCNSKYLINSADLKPDGRTVQCANCGNQWYQENSPNAEEILGGIDKNSIPKILKNSQNIKEKNKLPTPNLPSTYVKEKKVSILNSTLVIFFVIILVFGFWIIRNVDINNLVLLKYYYNEFAFNLKLIFKDIVKIIYRIIN